MRCDRRRLDLVSGACLLAASAALLTTNQRSVSRGPYASMHESTLRRLATATLRPEYPQQAVSHAIGGVAVAEVWVRADGSEIDRIEVVQAPSRAIATAVRDAVRRWHFRRLLIDPLQESWHVQSRLTFYFDVRTGTVRDPEEQAALVTRSGDDQTVPDVRTLNETEATRLAAAGVAQLVDTRSRAAYRGGHRPNSVNIPIVELATIASLELDTERPVVIDCGRESHLCEIGARVLKGVGFSDVHIIGPVSPATIDRR